MKGPMVEQLTAVVDISDLGLDIFRLAVEACPSGMVVVDDGGKIILANKEIERLFGYEREELRGQFVEMLLPEKSRGIHTHQRDDYKIEPRPRHMGTGRDLSGRHKNGREFPIEVGLNPFHVGPKVFVLGAIVDISTRKQIERLRDEFVSTVSHELRTPMTSIAASLGLLAGGKAGPLPDPAAHLIAIAHANCQRLIGLVNDILDIKKIESGQMTLYLQRYDAQLLLTGVVEANHSLAENRGVRIELKTLPNEHFVRVDADRFVQAVTNLLSNAINFSPRDKEVVISVAKRGKSIRIAIRDHGPGIPVKFKQQIFEKFKQADATPTTKKGGTGLGLNIARQIVELMKGQVGFEDAAGGGTIFYFDLPADDDVVNAKASNAGEKNFIPVSVTDDRPRTPFRTRARNHAARFRHRPT
jgi:PAS domain S-box-containing protein